jgi:uncharacterized protein (TIGR00251 family)
LVSQGEDGCVFPVHVMPRGRQDGVVGLYGDALKVRLTAPPVQGKANQALREFLAELGLGVPRASGCACGVCRAMKSMRCWIRPELGLN